MNIRKAVYSDYEGITTIISEFFDESIRSFLFELDPVSSFKTFEIMLEHHIVVIAIEDDKVVGIIAGTLAPADFNYEVIIATELIWFVTKKKRNSSLGIKLLNAFEKITEEHGATHIAMAYMENLQPEKVKDFYVKRGYKPLQTQYIRSLKE